MRKLSHFLISVLFLLLINVLDAEAVPDIRGEYSGTYTISAANCSVSSSNGDYNATLEMSIGTQWGATFTGSATGTFSLGGMTAQEHIQLSGTINDFGQISGTTSHSFASTSGEGTFAGQLRGDTLSIENPGNDTSGDTCTYERSMSAERSMQVELPREFKIFPSDGKADSAFGFSSSISGNYAIVGAYNDSGSGSITQGGAAYIFEKIGDNWIQTGKLMAGDVVAYDYFGLSVSMSGDYAVVGAYGDDDNGTDSGSAYIFKKDGGSWSQVAKLTPIDGAALYHFGTSVSISGDYAVVGGSPGSVYVFKRNASDWNQVAKITASDGATLDSFGGSVSISGNTLLVGAARNIHNGNSGSAYVFEGVDSSWTQMAKLTAPNDALYDRFGVSVSISGNSLIVGSYSNLQPIGSAFIFERNGATWSLASTLTGNEAVRYNWFGTSVSISGNYAIVGAATEGVAYVYEKRDGDWGILSKLTPSDEPYDANFGRIVTISGNNALVSAVHDNYAETFIGSAYAYSFLLPNNLANAVVALKIACGMNQTDISDLKDVNNDGLIGMEEAISELQSAAGLR